MLLKESDLDIEIDFQWKIVHKDELSKGVFRY